MLQFDNDDIDKLSPNVFPPQLLEIPEPPEQLYIRGVLPPENAILLAVVGSRKYSNYGKDVCEELIAGLAGFPIAIVSGLALGIDGIAHKAALKAGLATIAIPGSGLNDDVIYPATHFGLAQEILAAGGALLSEFEPDFRAANGHSKRNRIMADFAAPFHEAGSHHRTPHSITTRRIVVPNLFSRKSRGSNAHPAAADAVLR
jgi:DNA processing protein